MDCLRERRDITVEFFLLTPDGCPCGFQAATSAFALCNIAGCHLLFDALNLFNIPTGYIAFDMEGIK